MTRRRSIITTLVCTLGLLSLTLLLTGTPLGNAHAQAGTQAPIVAANVPANADGQIVASNTIPDSPQASINAEQADFTFSRATTGTTLNNSVIFLVVSFAAIFLTAWVSIFAWGRARS